MEIDRSVVRPPARPDFDGSPSATECGLWTVDTLPRPRPWRINSPLLCAPSLDALRPASARVRPANVTGANHQHTLTPDDTDSALDTIVRSVKVLRALYRPSVSIAYISDRSSFDRAHSPVGRITSPHHHRTFVRVLPLERCVSFRERRRAIIHSLLAPIKKKSLSATRSREVVAQHPQT